MQRQSRQSNLITATKRPTLILILYLLLVACAAPITPTAESSSTAPASTPGEAKLLLVLPVLQQFVGAINAKDYDTAYSLLTSESATTVKSATDLRDVYESAQSIATAATVQYAERGGVLQENKQALTLLVGKWQTALFGELVTTSTLTMTYETNAWRIDWTRDLVVPGMSRGRLSLARQPTWRGAIYASDNSPLAVQNQYMVLGISPGAIKDADQEREILTALSQVTELKVAEIKKKYADVPANWFVPIANIDEDTLSKYSSLIEPFDAISARPAYKRVYPQGDIAPHVVGFMGSIPEASIQEYQRLGYTGDESIGLSGVEGSLNETLNGRAGSDLQIVSGATVVDVIASAQLIPGRDVTLTISPTLQSHVQQILGKRAGAIVVMRPSDGAVLAMASYPTFNSSIMVDAANSKERTALLTDSSKPMLNRAIQGSYPPGSTFKMVTMAAGIGEGVTSPDAVFSDPGYWTGLGSGYRKTCWLKSGHGRITLKDGLTASCDVVFYTVGKLLDDKSSDLLPQYGEGFGFGTQTGIDLIGEVPGNVPDPIWKQKATGDVWTPGDTVNLAIGQGFMLATPLQVAQMTAAIANDGKLMQPHVIGLLGVTGNGQPDEFTPVEVKRLPISQETLNAMQEGMIGVTTNKAIGTTVSQFSSFDYYIRDGSVVAGKNLTANQRASATRIVIAGKSGTAQAPGAQDKPFAWFTAYVPAHDPQIAVTVLLENVGEGSSYAAPLVRQVIESYFGLPISDLPSNLQATD